MNNLSEDSTYHTSDLGLATFLLTAGHQLIETTQSNHSSNHLVFHFEKQENTERLVNEYLNREGLAPARTLFENYKALRALAFNPNTYQGGRNDQ